MSSVMPITRMFAVTRWFLASQAKSLLKACSIALLENVFERPCVAIPAACRSGNVVRQNSDSISWFRIIRKTALSVGFSGRLRPLFLRYADGEQPSCCLKQRPKLLDDEKPQSKAIRVTELRS